MEIRHLTTQAYQVYIILFIFLAFVSCKQNSQNEDIRYSIDFKDAITSINIDALIDSVFIVPLETKPNVFLSGITKILFHTDRCFILDKKQNVFVFNIDGTYITKIGSKGKARGEYLSCRDISIANNKIYLLDNWKLSMHEYDITNFQYIKSYAYNSTTSDAIVLNDYIFGKDVANGTILSSSKLNDSDSTKRELLSYQDQYDSKMPDQIVSSNQQAFWIDPGKGLFYELNPDGGFTPFLQINEPNLVLNEQERATLRNRTEIEQCGKISELRNFYMTNNHITFEYILNNKDFQVLYDKRDNCIYNIDVLNSSTPFVQSIYSPQAVYNNYFVRYHDNISLVKYVYKVYTEKHGEAKGKYSCYNEINHFNDNDNPLLIFYKLK